MSRCSYKLCQQYGGIKSQTYNKIFCRIWDFCTKNQLWVSAPHTPGAINIEADKKLSGNSILLFFKN